MTEVIAGPIIVWIGIGEIPSEQSLTGGALILTGITLMALCSARATSQALPFEPPIS
jgi:hypothetical protein